MIETITDIAAVLVILWLVVNSAGGVLRVARRIYYWITGSAPNLGQCAVCWNDPMLQPITLPCGHSFCGMCVIDMFNQAQAQGLNPVCPMCQQVMNRNMVNAFGGAAAPPLPRHPVEARPNGDVDRHAEALDGWGRRVVVLPRPEKTYRIVRLPLLVGWLDAIFCGLVYKLCKRAGYYQRKYVLQEVVVNDLRAYLVGRDLTVSEYKKLEIKCRALLGIVNMPSDARDYHLRFAPVVAWQLYSDDDDYQTAMRELPTGNLAMAVLDGSFSLAAKLCDVAGWIFKMMVWYWAFCMFAWPYRWNPIIQVVFDLVQVYENALYPHYVALRDMYGVSRGLD